MEKSEKEKRQEAAYKALQKAFVDVKGIQNIKASVVAFNKTVIIKKVTSGQEQTTEAGLILADTSSINSIKPNIGIIVAVGPDCSELMMPGLKVAYNQFANLEVFIRGEFYHVIHEHDVHCALTNDVVAVMEGKSDKEVRREKGLKGNQIAQQVFDGRREEIKDNFDFLSGKKK